MPLRCVSLRIPQAVWLVVSHPPTGSLADGGVPLLRQVFDRLSHARLSRVPSVDEEFSSSASYELKVVDMDGNGVDEVLETILSGHGGWYSHASTLLAFDELGTMRSIPIPVQGVLHTAERYNGNTGRSEILCEGGVTLEPASKGNQPHLRVYSAIVIPGEDTQECAPPQDEALWLKGSTLVATPQKRDRKARGRTRPKR